MGELIDGGTSGLASVGLIPMAIAAAAVFFYGLFSAGTKNNDDDDSSPGGGLMQPVA